MRPFAAREVDHHPHLHFNVDDDSLKTKLATLSIQEMAKRGCHGYASCCLNAAQRDAEVEQTMPAVAAAFTLMAEGLNRGSIDELLECELRQDAFRRFAR